MFCKKLLTESILNDFLELSLGIIPEKGSRALASISGANNGFWGYFRCIFYMSYNETTTKGILMQESDIRFFQERLSQSSDNIADIRSKMHDDVNSLSIEELYLVRAHLRETASLARLFENAVLKDESQKRKFFRKK